MIHDLITSEDVTRGRREEERNEAMNMYCKAQKTSSQKYRDGYDQIIWGKPSETFIGWRLNTKGTHYVISYQALCDLNHDPEEVLNYMIEADHISAVYGPFKAINREDALRIVKANI